MARPTVSQIIVDGLVRNGVTHVFGVVGDALNSVTDAIRRTDGINWIGTRHEEVAAFAAGAEAQLTGGLAACAGTVGPGAIHLLNGLYDAAKSHAPVLAIAGQVPSAELGSDYFQEVRNDWLFADVAVFTETIGTAEQVPGLVDQAIAAAVSRGGVAVLSLPGDVGAQSARGDRPVRGFVDQARLHPDDGAIERAARAVNAADRVTILAGIGAAGARREVLAAAETLSAPMVVTLKGKEAFDWDNPYQVGQSGLLGNSAAAEALKDCDLLLMVGTDFPYREWYPESATVVQIDRRGEHIGRRVPVEVGVVADAQPAMNALLGLLRPRDDRSHLDRAVDRYARWRRSQAGLADPGYDDKVTGRARSVLDNPTMSIRPEAVAGYINDLADDDAIFTVDTGMSAVWFSRFVQLRKGQRLLGSFNLGSMANAMPQALGAQCRFQKRQVIAFCGDGGITMLLGDLMTIARHRLPVKLVVFNNHRLGMVKLEQEEAGLPEFGTELDNPDLSAVATACGVKGVRINDRSELGGRLQEALTMPGPVLIDVVTNPDEISVPPQASPGQAWGFAISKLKETLRSVGDDD